MEWVLPNCRIGRLLWWRNTQINRFPFSLSIVYIFQNQTENKYVLKMFWISDFEILRLQSCRDLDPQGDFFQTLLFIQGAKRHFDNKAFTVDFFFSPLLRLWKVLRPELARAKYRKICYFNTIKNTIYKIKYKRFLL